MLDDRRLPTVSRRARRLAVTATAASALVLAGGIGLAAASDDDTGSTDAPAVESVVDDSTTSSLATEETVPVTEAPDDSVVESRDVGGRRGPGDRRRHRSAAERQASHPDNHGADVSAAAQDHSHDDDEEYGNHGAYVSSVAHGEVDDEGESSTDPEAETSSGKPWKGSREPLTRGRAPGVGNDQPARDRR